MHSVTGWRRSAAVLAVSLVGTLAACSSPSEVASDSGSDPASAPSSSAAASSGSPQEVLQAAYEGQMGTPPSEPTSPASETSVWIVSCGEQVPGCSIPTAAVKEAAETAGWTAEVCDGQLNPNGWGNCVRQGVSAGVDVMIHTGIDCASVQQPFQEAKDAGITIVANGGADCDASGGEKLFASELPQLEGVAIQELYELQGKLAADWLIGKTDGQAKVVQLAFTDPVWGPWLRQGFEDALAACEECEILTTLEYSNQDVGAGTLPQKFSTALLQAPDANGIHFPVGGIINLGLGQAVLASGRSDALSVIASLGTGPAFDLVRNEAGVDALVGYPVEWGSWGAVDTAIRVLDGQEPLPQGAGYKVVDAENNMPAAGEPFTTGVDYQAAYREAWGV